MQAHARATLNVGAAQVDSALTGKDVDRPSRQAKADRYRSARLP